MVAEQAGDQVQGQGEDDGRVLLGRDAVQGLDSKHETCKQYNCTSNIYEYLYNAGGQKYESVSGVQNI